MTDPIRVFVGASPAERVPFLVLKSSIERRASCPVEVVALCDLGDKVKHRMPKDPANRPRTPFSFQRFAIPSICDYKGRAIYLDSDMIVLDDIAKLWEITDYQTYGWGCVMATDVEHSARNAVLGIQCERARWSLDEIVDRLDSEQITYHELMVGLAVDSSGLVTVDRSIPERWNRLDEFVPGDTSLLHFTDMRRQPWRKRGHPLESMWLEEAAQTQGVKIHMGIRSGITTIEKEIAERSQDV